MDPVICCLLGICCPPASAEQRESLVKLLMEHFKGDETKARGVCDEAFETFAKATKKLAAAVKKAEAA
jgi:ribosome recycling factor